MTQLFYRFLKSDLYKDSLLADMGGTPLPFNGIDTPDSELRLGHSQVLPEKGQFIEFRKINGKWVINVENPGYQWDF